MKQLPPNIDLTRPTVELAYEYKVGIPVITRWRKEAGVVVTRGNPRCIIPDDVDLTASLREISLKHGVSPTTANTWKKQRGIAPNPKGYAKGRPRGADTTPKTQVAFTLPTSVVSALKSLAKDQDSSMTAVVIKLIREA